jgi:hypothetical protein
MNNNKRLGSAMNMPSASKKARYEESPSYANVDVDNADLLSSDMSTTSYNSTNETYNNSSTSLNAVCGKSIPLFLQKLYDLVDSSSCDDENKDVVSWNDVDPTLFVIYDTKKFEQKLFKQFFTSAYSSFKRQLCYYGFKKITDGPLTSHIPKRGVVYRQDNGLFCRDRPELLSEVKRTSRVADPKEETVHLRSKVDELQQEVIELRNELIEMRSLRSEFSIMRAELFELKQVAQTAKLMKPSGLLSNTSLARRVSKYPSDERNLDCTVPTKKVVKGSDSSFNQERNIASNLPKALLDRDMSTGSVTVNDLMQFLPRPMLDRDASTCSMNSQHWTFLKDALLEEV